jgi:hypothetical protein
MNKTLKFCYYLEFFSIQYNIITRSQGSDWPPQPKWPLSYSKLALFGS